MFQKFNNSSGISGFVLTNRKYFMYGILTVALVGFEMFNYSTTQYALVDVLGELSFAGLQWATILAIAFCGIDFAGIARLFTFEEEGDPTQEVWYLFGAWLLAATMNAILTWWGVSMALQGRELHSVTIMDKKLMLQVVPVFVAVMVWVTRVLLIGSFSMGLRHSRASVPDPARTSYGANQPIGRQPVQATVSRFEHAGQPPATASASHPPSASVPAIAPMRAVPPPHPEPEYIADGEAHPVGTHLPALRPLSASSRPSSSNQERRF